MKDCCMGEALEGYLNGHDFQATQQKKRRKEEGSWTIQKSSAEKRDESINTFRSRKCTMQ